MPRVLSQPVARTAVEPVIPGYDLLDCIGRGGLGIVYRARQRELERVVAIKMIRPEWLAEPGAVRRFRREARATARLCHPHIVGVFDAGHSGATHFLVMEYVPGLDLGRLASARGPLPVGYTCQAIAQAASGLAHANAHGLIHRDVKPANLIVQSQESRVPSPNSGSGLSALGSPLVKVLDFGLARLCQSRDARAESSVAGFLGTPDFVAPEQIEDPGSADARSDLYGLGCTFYFLLTGRVPFPGGTLVQKLDRHRWEAPVPVRELRPEVPAEVAAVVHRLLAKRPQDRYPSAAHLAGLLGQIAPAESAATRRPSVAPRAADTHREAAPTVFHAPACTAPDSPVHCLAIAADGARLLTAGPDRIVRVRDVLTGQELRRWTSPCDAVLAVAFRVDAGPLAATRLDTTLSLWDVDRAAEIAAWPIPNGADCAAISADGQRLVTGGADQAVWLWTVGAPRGRRLGGVVAERHWGPVRAVAISADGRRALSGGADRSLRLWDLESGRELRCCRDHAAAVCAVAFTPDGARAVSAAGPTLHLWDLASGARLERMEGHSRRVRFLMVTTEGRRVLSCRDDGAIHSWELTSGLVLAPGP